MCFYIFSFSELYVERIERKADALAQTNRQIDDRYVSSTIPSKSNDEESIPNDLLCPLCKRVYTDAVITPCCNLSFCDACKKYKYLFFFLSTLLIHNFFFFSSI